MPIIWKDVRGRFRSLRDSEGTCDQTLCTGTAGILHNVAVTRSVNAKVKVAGIELTQLFNFRQMIDARECRTSVRLGR